MFQLFDFIQSLDPATAEFLWTACVSTLLIVSTGISIWMLPWSDREIAEVDESFEKALARIRQTRPTIRTRLVEIRR